MDLNPFAFGRELDPDELVDRRAELVEIERAIRNRAKLFVIGSRRYGKTSLLAAAAARAEAAGVIVLRFDAEKYESPGLLAQALLTAATRAAEGPIERVTRLVGQVAARLKPEFSVDANTGALGVSLGIDARAGELPVLTDALDAIEQLAVDSGRETVVMLDEVQELVVEKGLTAEKQLRATVQRHSRVGYIFAGSATRLLGAMTSEPNRPFYRLGARIFIDVLPREDFREFLEAGYLRLRARVDLLACERVLDLARDVPYNVQRLAYEVWESLRAQPDLELSEEVVDRALGDLVRREDPAYTQIWTSLTRNQKKALKAVAFEGVGLLAAGTARAYDLTVPSMQRALETLEARDLIRVEPRNGRNYYDLVDPFMSAWLRWAQTP